MGFASSRTCDNDIFSVGLGRFSDAWLGLSGSMFLLWRDGSSLDWSFLCRFGLFTSDETSPRGRLLAFRRWNFSKSSIPSDGCFIYIMRSDAARCAVGYFVQVVDNDPGLHNYGILQSEKVLVVTSFFIYVRESPLAD